MLSPGEAVKQRRDKAVIHTQLSVSFFFNQQFGKLELGL